MKTIFCKNIRRDKEGKKYVCNGFLGTLSDAQLDVLRIDPEGRSEFRCHSCPQEMRWITLRADKGKLIFEPGPDKQIFYKEPKYDEVLISEQGG